MQGGPRADEGAVEEGLAQGEGEEDEAGGEEGRQGRLGEEEERHWPYRYTDTPSVLASAARSRTWGMTVQELFGSTINRCGVLSFVCRRKKNNARPPLASHPSSQHHLLLPHRARPSHPLSRQHHRRHRREQRRRRARGGGDHALHRRAVLRRHGERAPPTRATAGRPFSSRSTSPPSPPPRARVGACTLDTTTPVGRPPSARVRLPRRPVDDARRGAPVGVVRAQHGRPPAHGALLLLAVPLARAREADVVPAQGGAHVRVGGAEADHALAPHFLIVGAPFARVCNPEEGRELINATPATAPPLAPRPPSTSWPGA